MSKTLTEQWREGTLPDGAYYILVDKYEQNEPEIDVGVCYNSNFEWWIVKEVLEPVHSYDEYRELLDLNVYEKDRKKVMGLEDRVKRLQKQLKIARKAFVDILCDGDDYWDKDKAQEALTKMKGVK